MKARLQTPIGAGSPTVKPGATRSPEPVGPSAAVGDGVKTPSGTLKRDNEAARPAVPGQIDSNAPALPYAGDERRKKERRDGSLPTTLDTRKGGIDRRTKGRISLKV